MTRSTRILRSVSPLLAGSLLLGGMCYVDIAQATVYGINYDVVKTDTSLIANCKTDGNATVHHKFIIPRYGSPDIKQAVREELALMRKSGFESIRTIVELFPGVASSGDLINSGKIDDSVLPGISDYVRDVHDAGFKEIILAFGTQGPADPVCRKSEWGDCFDPATVAASVDAEAKIIRAAQTVNGISLRVDLLNEGCISDSGPHAANRNFSLFIHAAIKMHAANFPNVPATISCQLERTADGLVSTQHLFTDSGDHVGFFDIHAYPQSSRKEPEILLHAAQSLKKSDIPIIFGETTYADPDYRHWIVNAFQDAFHGAPQEILFWPLHSSTSHCGFEIAQPYNLKDAVVK
jgi:hypothetical protein